MDERRLIRSIGLNVNVMSLLLCSITYLLSSCAMEIEIPGKSGPMPTGPPVAVNFMLSIGSYTEENLVDRRSFNSQEPIPVVVRVAGDIYMYATLEEERPVTLRAAVPLEHGSKVRVIAYWGAPSYATVADSADYLVVAGDLLPISNNVTVTENETYKFVAFSFNDDTTPLPNSYGSFNALNYANPDLLWGVTETFVSGVANNVVITLDHLFSRLRVEATTDSITIPPVRINRIDGVYVTPSYSNLFFNANTTSAALALAPIDVKTINDTFTCLSEWFEQGTSTSGLPLTSSNLDRSAVESNYSLIHTHGSDTIALKITHLAVNNIDLGAYEFRFSNVNYPQLPMRPGYSYALKLNFRRLVWAGSNIYWDDNEQRLTFLPETTLPWEGQGYQGVYFMWGSLVGISPVGHFIPNGTELYVPNVAVSPTSSVWSTQSGTLANIPHVRSGSIVSTPWLDNHTSRNYLVEIHDTAYVNLRGDICKYLTGRDGVPDGKWRMPNAREFGPDPSGYDMVNSLQRNAIVTKDGKFDFYAPTGFHTYITKKASNTIFPTGLGRDVSGTLNGETHYLSGSPAFVANSNVIDTSYSMFFMPLVTGTSPVFNYSLKLGVQGLVRCVKIDSGGRPFDLVDPSIDVEEWKNGGPLGRQYSDTQWQGEVWY